MLPHFAQVLLSTASVPGAPLPVTTDTNVAPVSVQFQHTGYAHTYTAQPMQPGLPPSPPVATPGAGGDSGTGRKVDTMKTFALGSYATAKSLVLAPDLSAHEFAQRLESYRTLCHELINKSWAAGRMDLAAAVASDAVPLYRRCAQHLIGQAQVQPPSFYANFVPWGLDNLNASLQRLPMMGHVLRYAWHPRSPDGRFDAPQVLVLRTAEPPPQTRGQRSLPGVWREVRDATGSALQAPAVKAGAGKTVARQDKEERAEAPVDIIERLWQMLALTRGMDHAAFNLLMKQHTHFMSNVERVRFGMALVELLKGLVNLYRTGNLKMERDVFAECLSSGFTRIGLLNRAYHDKFGAELPPAHGWPSGSAQEGEEGEEGEEGVASLERDAVRVHFIWSLGRSRHFFGHFRHFFDTCSHAVPSWIAPQRVVSLLEAHFSGERSPVAIVLSERELHCLATLSFNSGEKAPANFVRVVRYAAQRLVELPPLPVFTVPPLPGGTSVGTSGAGAGTASTATTAAPAAGNTGGPSSAPAVTPAVTPSTAAPMLEDCPPAGEFESLFGRNQSDDFY